MLTNYRKKKTASFLLSHFLQVAPINMFTEKNTGTNLPAQIELYATTGNEYNFMFIAKGGGSANKTFLYQQTKALLNPEKLMNFIDEKVKVLFPSFLSEVLSSAFFLVNFWKEAFALVGYFRHWVQQRVLLTTWPWLLAAHRRNST